MSIRQDFTPVVNGKLCQIGAAFRSSREHVKSAVFKCECGGHIVTMVRLVAMGTTKTCGKCRPRIGKDDTWNRKRSKAYIAWMNMRQRCLNPQNKDYANYGNRGVTICPEWSRFAQFSLDVGEPPQGMSIERIDNTKGYSKANCTWATVTRQNRNKRSNTIVELNGIKMTLAEASERLNLNRRTVSRLWRKHGRLTHNVIGTHVTR